MTALLHNPPLLILDEPTVGVDLILRETIWKHLEFLCKSGLTVILTTHYIEEARSAMKVGFMRSGRLLAEDSPNALIRSHNLNTLEAVFLKLSQLQDQRKTTNNLTFHRGSAPKDTFSENDSDISLKVMKTYQSEPPMNGVVVTNAIVPAVPEVGYVNHNFVSDSPISLENMNSLTKNYNLADGLIQVKQETIIKETNFSHRLFALTLKNFKQMSRNYVLLLFFVLLPSIEISLLIMCIGQPIKDIPVSVYNPEKLDASQSLSELFLNTIDTKHIKLIRYKTLESAIEAVKLNDVWAVIHFRPNFTEALRMRAILSSDSDSDIIDASSIRIQLDMSNQVIGFQIQRQIFEAFLKFVGVMALSYGINPEALKPPIIIDPPIYGVPKQSLISFIAPGALIVVAYFATTVMTTHLLIKERNDGLVERSLVAGVTPFEFVLSHIFLQTLLLAFQVGAKLVVAFLIFTTPNSGSILSAVSLTFLQGICGLMFGLMISAVCHDEIYANTLGIGTFFPSVMIGGIFWPLESMPTVLRGFSQLLPSTLAIEALRCILLRGWGLEHMQVLIGYVITLLWLIFFLVNAIIFFKKKL